MRTEAEIRSALIHLLVASMKQHTEERDMAVIRTLAWTLNIGSVAVLKLSVEKRIKPKRLRVAADHFAI